MVLCLFDDIIAPIFRLLSIQEKFQTIDLYLANTALETMSPTAWRAPYPCRGWLARLA